MIHQGKTKAEMNLPWEIFDEFTLGKLLVCSVTTAIGDVGVTSAIERQSNVHSYMRGMSDHCFLGILISLPRKVVVFFARFALYSFRLLYTRILSFSHGYKQSYSRKTTCSDGKYEQETRFYFRGPEETGRSKSRQYDKIT